MCDAASHPSLPRLRDKARGRFQASLDQIFSWMLEVLYHLMVRKCGSPPLNQVRGQAPLPDCIWLQLNHQIRVAINQRARVLRDQRGRRIFTNNAWCPQPRAWCELLALVNSGRNFLSIEIRFKGIVWLCETEGRADF